MAWYLDQLLRWIRGEADAIRDADTEARMPRVKTQLSATVFTGEPDDWLRYLNLAREDRYSERVRVGVRCLWAEQRLEFVPKDEISKPLAECLEESFALAQEKAQEKAHVLEAFDRMVFSNTSNRDRELDLRISPGLPCDASREVLFDDELGAKDVTLVLRATYVEAVLPAFWQAHDKATPEERLGLSWPLFFRVLAQLGYHNYPRDRFVEKIDLMTQLALVTVNLLYDKKSRRRLKPNPTGELYHRHVCLRDHVEEKELFEVNSWFRLLNELGFMLDERTWRDYQDVASAYVREFLDSRYLRLSLAGVMPDVTEAMAPMPLKRKKGKIKTPKPRIGQFGILDDEDLAAWKKVGDPFQDMGFTLLRQLGIGQFGRVYEALNGSNPHIPLRVAIKVDRIRRGEKQQAIQHADVAMQIGRDLSIAPHVIRLYDAGKLKGKRFTFHIIQLVDGDTLDNLIGVTGLEHSSIHRPDLLQSSEQDIKRLYLEAMRGSRDEAWRRLRLTRPFTDPLTLSQMLDLLTSKLLWVEEVHGSGYAVNDLKNGNLMVSRRGQLKGIDLDSYSPIRTSQDRIMDFYFLAVSTSLYLLNVTDTQRRSTRIVEEGLLHNRDVLRKAIRSYWPYGNVSDLCNDRVSTDDVLDFLLDLVSRCRDHSYAEQPDRFSEDIDRLIRLKRTVFAEELVLD
jgi:hypothetical protein